MAEFTHLDEKGQAQMVDVGAKSVTERMALASGAIRMDPKVASRIASGSVSKGDVLAVARIAGILAAKKTADLIPLCHPLGLDTVSVDFVVKESRVTIQAIARCHGKTGVEMEALIAVSVAALTIYDMCKSLDRSMTIEDIRLEEKSGGRSGHFKK